MIPLKQNTAGQEIPLGPFVDSTDGNTEETGLTIANTDIKLWKFGATTLANKNSGGATHISNGIYYCVLDATDTNTLGTMQVSVHVTGSLYVWVDCLIMTAEAYETFINDGVLEHLLASHNTADTFGEKINAIGTASELSDAILDETIGDGTITLRQAVRGFISTLIGKVSGGGTATVTFRNDADSKNVIVATVDANGNRSAVTFTP